MVVDTVKGEAAEIEAVLFDVAGVLTSSLGSAFLDGGVTAGVDLDAMAESLLPMFAGAGDGDLAGHRLERGEITLEGFFDSLGDLGADARTMMSPSSPHFFGTLLTQQAAMHAFVDEVRALGLKIAAVSNHVVEWDSTWHRLLEPQDRFDLVVLSGHVGMRKPSPGIYLHALERLDVAPDAALFLDDFGPMVDGARAVGMHAIEVSDHDAAIAHARALLAASSR